MGQPATMGRDGSGRAGGVALGLILVLATGACSTAGPAPVCHPSGTELHIAVAEGTSHRFDMDCLAAPANQAFTIEFRNQDNSPHGAHNITIAREDGELAFSGEGIGPGRDIVYEVQALPAGTYEFRCDNHPAMNGTLIVELIVEEEGNP